MEDLKAKFPDEDILKILRFIAERRGVELSSYRRNFIDRHLRSRLVDTHAGNYLDYINHMKENPGELDLFLDALSINVTHFFRDKDVWDSFKQNIIPELFQNRETGGEKKLIRIWSAACASGQEPYTIAMLMNEAAQGHAGSMVRIYATDVDNDALNKARAGRFAAEGVKDIPLPFLGKYFEREDGAYVARDELKALIRFDRHNLISDPPLKFLDVIFCRNVMIYFNRQQQDALMAKFAQGLNTKGILVIAKVESIWEKDFFVPVDHVRKIYRKV